MRSVQVLAVWMLLPVYSLMVGQVNRRGETNAGSFGIKPPVLTCLVSIATQSGSEGLGPGENVSIDVTVSNGGGCPARNVVARMVLPANVSGFRVSPDQQLGDIDPFTSKRVRFTLSAEDTVRSQGLSLEAQVFADYGVRMETKIVTIPVKARQRPRDFTPPQIELSEPLAIATRGFKLIDPHPRVTTDRPTVRVRGIARDTCGIMSVSINRQEIPLSRITRGAGFDFSFPLAVGLNEIEILAVDSCQNPKALFFTVTREEGFIIGKYFALIMAVQEYDDRRIPPLETALKEAREFRKVLAEDYTFEELNITFLTNPNRKEILGEFRKLRQRVGEDDNLLIFFAGHGEWDEEEKEGYWLPSDASMEERSDWIPNDQVRTLIKGIRSKHTLLISDACFAGSLLKTRMATTKADVGVEQIYSVPSRQAMTSGATKPVPAASVFLQYVVKRLKENKAKYLLGVDLYSSIAQAVAQNSPMHQTPVWGALPEAGDEGGGHFVFVRKPAASQ